MMRPAMSRPRGDRDGERGQILVLFTIVLVVILGFTALVIDLGLLRNNRQTPRECRWTPERSRAARSCPVDGSQARRAPAAITALIDKTVGNDLSGLVDRTTIRSPTCA